MAWYNLLRLFRRSKTQTEEDGILHCDNPQCQGVIEEDEITYDEEHKEIYHVGECGIFATAHRALKSDKGSAVQNVDYIPRKKALELLRDGKLRQSQRLEERV